ncbi:MAG: chorismate mutase, partial [Clostridia bacterium]|nr:chorismate mutase [Clostridia bacterium]
MDLSEIRKKIDEIDSKLLPLFLERMNLSAEVAAYKKANNLPVL